MGLLRRWALRRWEGQAHILAVFEQIHGYRFDSKNVTTFTEKLCRRMLNLHRRHNPLFAQLADKYAAREYIRKRVGSEYLVPLLWHGSDPGKLPFEKMPKKCVVKTNHDCGSALVLDAEDKMDRDEVVHRVRRKLAENYYWASREAQYAHIKPRVLVEEYLEDGQPSGPLDYRFWCFNGKPLLIQVDNRVHGINPFYDPGWSKTDLNYREAFRETDIEKPKCLDKMLGIASVLSQNIGFVRVDLYLVGQRILCGEFAFSPVAGRLRFNSAEWDAYMGAHWQLND
ncbi:MAG: ATP-grasp fold amidoligase family protein [Candidatus Methylacidiphilales bacterium]|nr:ATP-grasp fold amidoligase family protein [Candidatus Methylacidiphilales bacterium]